jgi:hypothetical protein
MTRFAMKSLDPTERLALKDSLDTQGVQIASLCNEVIASLAPSPGIQGTSAINDI